MAALSVARLVFFCVVLTEFQLTRLSSCSKVEDSAASTEAQAPGKPPLQGKEVEGTPVTAIAFPEEEGENLKAIKFKNIEIAVESVAGTGLKHGASQSLLPALLEVENLSRDALLKVSTRACKEDETAEDLTNIVSSLVRLLSAVKAVRDDVGNVSKAWEELRDSIRRLAEDEKHRVEQSGKAGQSLARFLEAQMWMLLKIELMQYSKQVLKKVAEQHDVRQAVSVVGDAAKSLTSLVTRLSDE